MKKPKWSLEEQQRSDELCAASNTMQALHELQGHLIQTLKEHGGDYGYGRGKVHVHLLFPELFKQFKVAAEGMFSIAEHELKIWRQNYPVTDAERATREPTAE